VSLLDSKTLTDTGRSFLGFLKKLCYAFVPPDGTDNLDLSDLRKALWVSPYSAGVVLLSTTQASLTL
jgi:hypothetical protein